MPTAHKQLAERRVRNDDTGQQHADRADHRAKLRKQIVHQTGQRQPQDEQCTADQNGDDIDIADDLFPRKAARTAEQTAAVRPQENQMCIRDRCAPTEEKILCRSPFLKRSPVSGLRQTILGKGWKPWCLPSCAPAGQARFRSLRKRSTTVWQRLTNNTDNRNFEKAKEEGKNLPLSFTFSEIPADGGVPPDDKSGSLPRRTSPHTRS